MGVSADHIATLEGFTKTNGTKHLLLSDFRRTMLPAYDAMVTDEKSPIYRYGKRAYFIVDREGMVKYVKVLEDPRQLLDPNDVLAALKSPGK